MSRMADSSKPRSPKRVFDEEFKDQAVRLVLEEGKTVSAAARDLGLTTWAFRIWAERARVDRTQGKTGLTTAEREELARPRKAVRELQRRSHREVAVDQQSRA